MLEQLDNVNHMLLEITGKPAFRRANEKIVPFGFPGAQVPAMLENTAEGELHTGMMMRSLTDYAIQQGVEIKTGAGVLDYEEAATEVIVYLDDPVRKAKIGLQCSKLYICTNAFSKQLLPEAELEPGRGQVLITEPIPDLPFQGIFHFDKGYYYFREIEGRILFGGGRNLDKAGETTTQIGLHERIQADLEDKLRQIILPGREVTIAQRWAGIMAFGAVKKPVVEVFSPRVSGAFRMGGMGVALGALAAQELVALGS